MILLIVALEVMASNKQSWSLNNTPSDMQIVHRALTDDQSKKANSVVPLDSKYDLVALFSKDIFTLADHFDIMSSLAAFIPMRAEIPSME